MKLKTSALSEKKRFIAADVIRVLAIIGVVSIHTLIAVYDRADFQGGVVWWISNIWNAFSRSAIPLFIMLSGFLLIPKKESIFTLFQRIICRLLIPLLVIYPFFQFWNNGTITFANLNPLLLISALLQAKVGIFYFLIIMIGLYVLLPLIRKVFLPLSFTNQLLLSVSTVILGMIAVVIEYKTQVFLLSNALFICAPYVGFFLIGHVLPRIRLSFGQKVFTTSIYFVSVASSALLSNFYLNQIQIQRDMLFPPAALSQYFDFHLSPNIVIMSITLFLLLFQSEYKLLEKSLVLKNIIKKISAASFGIYLTHLLVISILESYFSFTVDYSNLPLIIYLPIKFLLVFGSAYGLTVLVSNIPYIRSSIGSQKSV